MIRQQQQHHRRIAVVDLQGAALEGFSRTDSRPGRFVSRLIAPNTAGTLSYKPPPDPAAVPVAAQWPAWITDTPWFAWAGGATALLSLYSYARRHL